MPARFDFVNDSKFRHILEADYKEMQTCAEAQVWKAVNVLAGSIVEAVIVDYLIAEGRANYQEAMKLTLGQAIKLAPDSGILSDEIFKLSAAINDYRNLVHPGRSVRLQKIPDENRSNIAMVLVDMICKELGDRKGSHGYTAEQIISKVQRDSSVGAILQDLLRDVSQDEIRRLLKKLIPDTYYEELNAPWSSDDDQHVLPALEKLFRTAYGMSDTNVQEDVALNFVRILKEESSHIVTQYGLSFWWMDQLQHLCPDDIQMIKRHFFSRISTDQNNAALISLMVGIGKYLTSEEVSKLVDVLIRIKCFENEEAGDAASRVLDKEYWNSMNQPAKDLVMKRLEQWRKQWEQLGRDDLVNIVEKEKYSIEIPF